MKNKSKPASKIKHSICVLPFSVWSSEESTVSWRMVSRGIEITSPIWVEWRGEAGDVDKCVLSLVVVWRASEWAGQKCWKSLLHRFSYCWVIDI